MADRTGGQAMRGRSSALLAEAKSGGFVGDVNATFTHAIEDLRRNWQMHRDRFLGETKP
jgi:hypothetical protein